MRTLTRAGALLRRERPALAGGRVFGGKGEGRGGGGKGGGGAVFTFNRFKLHAPRSDIVVLVKVGRRDETVF